MKLLLILTVVQQVNLNYTEQNHANLPPHQTTIIPSPKKKPQVLIVKSQQCDLQHPIPSHLLRHLHQQYQVANNLKL